MSVFTDDELKYLGTQRLGRLATIDPGGRPHVVPVGFQFNEQAGTIDIGGQNLAATRKFQNVAANPNVAFVVDDVLPPWMPRSIEVQGHAEAIGEGDAAIIRITPARILTRGLDGTFTTHSRAIAPAKPRAAETEESEGRFMVAVGAVIEHVPTGKILLVKRSETRSYMPDIWEDPMGRMKQFEEPEEALRREVKEETGLEIEIVKPLQVVHAYRGDRRAEKEWVGIVYWCRTQSDNVVLSPEHSAFRWVSSEEALAIVDQQGISMDIQAFVAERTR
jgi:pyridoxamine 5'-phosphate oxidase family protein